MDLKFVFGNPNKRGGKKKGQKSRKKVASKKKTRKNKRVGKKAKRNFKKSHGGIKMKHKRKSSKPKGGKRKAAKRKKIKKSSNPLVRVWKKGRKKIKSKPVFLAHEIKARKEKQSQLLKQADEYQKKASNIDAKPGQRKRWRKMALKARKNAKDINIQIAESGVRSRQMIGQNKNLTSSGWKGTNLVFKEGEEKMAKKKKSKKAKNASKKKAVKVKAKKSASKKKTSKKKSASKKVSKKAVKQKSAKKKSSKRKSRKGKLRIKVRGKKFSSNIPKLKKRNVKWGGFKQGKGKNKKSFSVMVKRNPMGGNMPSMKQVGNEFKSIAKESAPIFVGGAVNGAINKTVNHFIGRYINQYLTFIPNAGVVVPTLLGTLIEAGIYAGFKSKLGKSEKWLKGMIAANIANLGADLVGGYVESGLQQVLPMAGVNFTPSMRGVNFTPKMSGVNFTPAMRGLPQMGQTPQMGRADFGRADFGKLGEYEESPADFGHSLEGDVGSEDDVQLG